MRSKVVSLLMCFLIIFSLSAQAFASEKTFSTSGESGRPDLTPSEILQLIDSTDSSLPETMMLSQASSADGVPGTLNPAAQTAALQRLNLLRKLAGLPSVQLNKDLSDSAQYGALLIAHLGYLSHDPDKPAGFPDAAFKKGHDAVANSNLSAGRELVEAVDAFMNDSLAAKNLQLVGHRRWQLNPSLGQVGFGYVETTSGYQSYIAERIVDFSGKGIDWDYISWPASGSFPTDYLCFTPGTAWSVSVNPARYASFTQSDITVTLTEVSSGRSWVFRGNGYDPEDTLYFGVDVSNRGLSNAIIFRPDNITQYSGQYTVEISGLKTKDGKATSLAYQTEMFSVDELRAKQANQDFADVPTEYWGYAAIHQAYLDGVVKGVSYNAGTGVRLFDPDRSINTAEFVTILMRAIYPATDISAGSGEAWYTKAMSYAESFGWLSGASCSRPSDLVSRNDMAQILFNALRQTAPVSDTAGSPVSEKISDYVDIPDNYREAVLWCYDSGLILGVGNQVFSGFTNMTRAQIATVYLRIRQLLA